MIGLLFKGATINLRYFKMKKAIVLGGTHDHIRLIEILKGKGYFTYLIDYLENPPARNHADEYVRESILDMEAVSSLSNKIKPNIVMAACIDQALLTTAQLCEKLKLPCHISYQTAIELTNKALMKNKFAAHQIPTTPFIVQRVLQPESVARLKFPLVVKPVDSNSSKGISKIITQKELESAAITALAHSRSKHIIMEEYMEGEEFSVDVAVKNGVPTVLLVTKNIKMPQSEKTFTIVQSYFPATTDTTLLSKINDIVKQIVVAYNIRNSPLLVQLIHNNGELYVIEFSARLGGGSKHHLIKKITGFDVLEWFVDVIHSQSKEISIRQNYNYACINYLYARKGKIASFEGFEESAAEGIIDEYYYYKTPGMQITNHIASSDRPAGYLITDQKYDSFLKKLTLANEKIAVLDEHGSSLTINNQVVS